MKCVKCGYEIYEGDICPLCGCKNSTTNSGASTTTTETSYTQTGDTGFTPADTAEVSIESSYSMKWYKFLKVILWFGIISNVIATFTYFTGLDYQGFEDELDELYEMLPSLKSLNMFAGVFGIVMTVFTFIVWRSLHNYKSIGPKLLTVMYIVNTAFNAIYMFAFSSIIGSAVTTMIYGDTYIQGMYQYQEYLDLTVLSSASVAPTIIQIIGGIVMIIANHNYFKNRSDLFVN